MKAIEPSGYVLRELARRRRRDAWRNGALIVSLGLNAALLAAAVLVHVNC